MANLNDPPMGPPDGDEQPSYRALVREWRVTLVAYLRGKITEMEGRLIILESSTAISASASASTSLVATVYKKVVFGTEDWDDNGEWASSTFTVTTEGRYAVDTAIDFSIGAIGDRCRSAIYKNGTSIATAHATAATAARITVPVGKIIELAVGDTIEIWAQNLDSNDTVGGVAEDTYVQIKWVGDNV